jgi:transposase
MMRSGSETLATEKGAWANIPPRSNRNDPICFSPQTYRARNQVERFFNKIKHCRRIATRMGAFKSKPADDVLFTTQFLPAKP